MASNRSKTGYTRIPLLFGLAVSGLGAGIFFVYQKAITFETLSTDSFLIAMLSIISGTFFITMIALMYLHKTQIQISQLRKKAEKVLMMRDATVRIDESRFTELRSVANLINYLMDQIDDSLETRRSLAELDTLILSGADLTAIIRRCLLASKIDSADTLLLLRDPDGSSEMFLHELDGLSIRRSSVSTFEANNDAFDDLTFYPEFVQRQYTNVLESYPIACDETPYGLLFVRGERTLTASETKRLEDLVDRISVAVTNIKRSETLYNQANFDPLTGLVNRRAFEERLSESLHRAKRDESGVILFMDLDGFKKVNDTAGHEAGDYLLTLVAEKLSQIVRPEDTIARLGGDEFAVIAANCTEEKEISDLCMRIVEALTDPVTIDRMDHTIGTSIGIARYPADGTQVDELVTKADSAMYKAKQEGGSRFAFFDDTLKAVNDHRVLVESRLRAAIKERSLSVHFQPKLNLSAWSINSAEALLRWRDEQLGETSPDEFIGIAEESGLMPDIMPILIEQTADLLAQSASLSLPLERIAINASPKQIMTEDFALNTLSQLDAHRVPHEKIEIEVTESVFAKDLNQVLVELHILRMAGIKVALDDFGTGYSSLNMLRELPLDVVKIDRAFITELDDSEQARSMLKHLIEMANVLNLEVVAEGVETDVQLQYLLANGCDYIQGWFISKALSPIDFLTFLRNWGQGAENDQIRALPVR